MHILGLLVLSLQALCVVHAMRTRRDDRSLWLIYIPGVGLVAYIVMELLPDVKRSGAVRHIGAEVASFLDPGWNVRLAEEALAEADSLHNRHQLGRARLRSGDYDKAVAVYEGCLAKPGGNEPPLRLEHALALHLSGANEKAKEKLESLRAEHPSFKRDEVGLLWSQVLESLDELAGAAAEYADLVKHFPGEEARCRYALLLERLDRREEARALFEEIVRRNKHAPAHYRRAQRQWISVAGGRLRG